MIEIQETCRRRQRRGRLRDGGDQSLQEQGFNTGQPLDVRTAEKCTASLWVSGQTGTAECPVETVVLRAACQ